MSKDIKKALEHCIEWDCVDCPNREELGSGETVCRGRLLTDVLEYVSDIETKLAEMKNKSFILYSMLYETLEKQGCEDIASQIDQMTSWTYDKEVDWLKGNRNYDQLKQKLKEKEKFLERIMSGEYIPANIAEKSLKLSNQTAIEKLEKVKKLLVEKMKLASDKLDCAYYINQQINELKGKVEDE